MYGIKKLISTSYAASSNNSEEYYQVSLFEQESPKYDEKKTKTHGKMFVLDRDKNKSGRIDIEDLDFEYLEGDGDFRSEEVKKLRDEADIIITNPPFSLFREFMAWIMEAEKDFLIIGNVNAITYKEFFPYIKENKVWMGESIKSGDRKFNVPDNYPLDAAGCGVDSDGKKYIRVKGVRWFTNLDHGRRHRPLQLMTIADNIMYNKKLKGQEYQKYDNYDAIEVGYTNAIPSDYCGIMGVPITFLDKYNPEQFEILGSRRWAKSDELIEAHVSKNREEAINDKATLVNGKATYDRIFIKWKKDAPGYEGE